MATGQNYSVTLSRVGLDFGVWAGKTGGESTRESSDYYPGAMLPARKMLGIPTTSDITIRKMTDDLTDAQVRDLYTNLTTLVRYKCVVQRLAAQDKPVGASRAYECLIGGVAEPDADASSTDPAEITVTLSVFGLPTIA